MDLTRTLELSIVSALSFLAGMGVAFTLVCCKPSIVSQEPPPQVEIQTNATDRAEKPDTSWFSDNSNYIWDGWKIK